MPSEVPTMRRMCFYLITFALTALATTAIAADQLKQYQWKQRVLLIHANENAGAIRLMLDQNQQAINERDLVWFLVSPSGIQSNHEQDITPSLQQQITNTLKESPGAAAVLIGKDGSIKGRYSDLNLDVAFGLIDTMPMRKKEMSDP
ncbi:DUF4174 domain-containing protein [Microbulbifer agarilyticus]|uniref:DUF4174 domain-containing protein n=1 Tax=Microbulbifer agarilyticus TaxID=260552 RepID=UPI001C94077A|nr:DUF4174 domain-containing protein [Microbulbifer agarilyticus]MBY6212197.1 DUF4174 domain-containing protein [Microbulbifer agarilyticus]